MQSKSSTGHQYILLVITLFLTLFGIALVYSSSAFVGTAEKNDTIAFVRKQFLSLGVGFLILFLFWRIDYLKLEKVAPLLIGLTLVLLLLVFVVPSVSSTVRVKRYLRICGINIIPSEAAKLSLVIYLSGAFAKKVDLMNDFWKGAFPQCCVVALVCCLVFLQPSHTNAIFLGAMGIAVWYFAGGSWKHLLILGLVFVLLSTLFLISHRYPLSRVQAFLWQLCKAPSPNNYHTYQAALAMVHGGVWGVGLGNSQQVLHYLPEAHTDFLWAVIAEEVGLLLSLGLMLFFFLIILSGYRIALNSRDLFAKFLAAGLVTSFALQTLMHLCVVTGLMPTTGVALPLMSYGGSSLVTTMAGIGILMSISRYAGHFELEG